MKPHVKRYRQSDKYKETHQKYLETPKGIAVTMWYSLNRRAGNKFNRRPTYTNVEVRMSKEEFYDWVIPELERWIKDGKPLHGQYGASLDRKDNSGHYEITNLQIISKADNSRKKSDNRNINPPIGKAWCGSCKDYLLTDQFWKDSKNQHGLQYNCKVCRKKMFQNWKSRMENLQTGK